MKEIFIKMDFGDGWASDQVDVMMPFALVTFKRKGALMHARLDLDKRIFIDAPPEGASKELASKLVDQIVEKIRPKTQLA
ncbi:hypothetical protein [Chromobacterium subtsugae]|uniref:hypothetical protein n=1 Tax=Chromobacterium subtsugae TaxID=251747 RepID=UPI000641175F|nr:hypothetical protein [Chromobacterium subtsugae]